MNPLHSRFQVLLGVLLLAALSPIAIARQHLSMDFGWRFSHGDAQGSQNSAFDDTSWRKLDLPHDWGIEGPFEQKNPSAGSGGYAPSGIGWYRKHFLTPAAFAGKQVTVQFDGVFMNADVYLNGHLIGHQPYGYTSFVCDLTPFLSESAKDNILAVRVDTSLQPDSRWYSGSGIYRHVWVDVTEDVHVASWGTFVTTPDVSADSATVQIQTELRNDGNTARSVKVRQELIDAGGKVVAQVDGSENVPAKEGTTFTQKMMVTHPLLWTLEKPAMYTVRTTILPPDSANEPLDTYDTPIGIRRIAYDVDKGFLLNGERVKMLGMCVHPDGGAFGSAVPDGVWERRLKLLKAMGCNAIRCSHNPPSPEFLDLCDRLGFLVMDESFDEWTKAKGQLKGSYFTLFAQWSQKDLTAMLHRDRNHPSIVIWSVGNEIPEQSSANGAELLKPLVDTCHREDPTRPVTSACDKINSNTPTKQDFLSLLDIAGYNYVDRWGNHREIYFSDDREKFPQRRFIGTEDVCIGGVLGNYFGAEPARGGAPAAPNAGFFYASNMIRAEQLWKFNATHDYVVGYFMWTGVDYLGEANWPRRGATSGVLDSCGFPKDGYYFYQSQWTSQPMVHLFPHWNYPGERGTVIPVIAYSNCQTIELLLNGKSFGTKSLVFPRTGSTRSWNDRTPSGTTADLHLEWDVPYEPGTLLAIGKRDGKEVAREELHTAGKAAAISLKLDKTSVGYGNREVANLEVRITDADGNLVPTADNSISFEAQGAGQMIAVDNGDMASTESYQGSTRKTFNGMCLAVVQATGAQGHITVTAKSDGLKDASVDLEIQPVSSPNTLP